MTLVRVLEEVEIDLGAVHPRLKAAPYGVVSLLEMLNFYAQHFMEGQRVITASITLLARGEVVTAETMLELRKTHTTLFRICERLGLESPCAQLDRIGKATQGGTIQSDVLARLFNEFQDRLSDELSNQIVLMIPFNKKNLYVQNTSLFGREVESRFPHLIEDISEAGKCIALARFTAGVFHLMRIMEVGVQEFGTKLAVEFSTGKTWGVILNESKTPITNLPQGHPQKATLSEAWAHLDSVRLAWRNEVMHPKQTYTEEEATEIFGHVRAYMRHLASIL